MDYLFKIIFIAFLTQNINAQEIHKFELPTQKLETFDLIHSLSWKNQLHNSLTTPKYYNKDKFDFYSFSFNKPIQKLGNNYNLFYASSDVNWGFEGATSLSFGLNWHINDKLILTGTPFLTSYFFGPMDNNRSTSAGFSVILTYKPNDWLTIRTFGQYAYNSLNNSFSTSLIAPQNNFGGEIYVKFSDTFGGGGGVKYINNRGEWTPQFYTSPIFKIDVSKKK